MPTPFDSDTSKTDDSAVIESLESLEDKKYNNCIIIKSTLPPGSCDSYHKKYNLKIVYNPEFLRESTSPDKDFRNQETVVIGTPNIIFYNNVVNLYKTVLKKQAEYFHTSFLEAEMVKLSQNTMLASRVALANIIFETCQKIGVNYEIIKNIGFDRFEIIGPHMVQVPGPDGQKGFGGKCLPKDISAFNTISDSEIIRQMINYNKNLRNDLDD